jgi:hypothetical protein
MAGRDGAPSRQDGPRNLPMVRPMPDALRQLPPRLRILMSGLRRWLTYRPERRFMRG